MFQAGKINLAFTRHVHDVHHFFKATKLTNPCNLYFQSIHILFIISCFINHVNMPLQFAFYDEVSNMSPWSCNIICVTCAICVSHVIMIIILKVLGVKLHSTCSICIMCITPVSCHLSIHKNNFYHCLLIVVNHSLSNA